MCSFVRYYIPSMPEYTFFLGSHPRLSELEITKVLGNRCRVETVAAPLPLCVAKCEADIPENLFDRLGGTDRVSIILGRQPQPWDAGTLLEKLSPLPKKWMLGLGTPDDRLKLNSLAFELKSGAQEQGSKLKFVLPKGNGAELNAAQVIFNRLDQAPNAELVLVPSAQEWWALKTIWIQDIRAYEIRDTARPARSGEVGMLPPKLAQIMINVAVGDAAEATIFDPFCGMGTTLQEGQLMGYHMIGSDNNKKMVEATQVNLAWLAEHFDVSSDPVPKVFLHDAQQAFPKEMIGTVDAVVAEPHLGPPLRSPAFAKASAGRPLLQKLGTLYIQAFRNFLPVLETEGKVVFIFPAFAQKRGQDFVLFPEGILDAIEKLGYRRVHPFGSRQELLYARPDAWVGRELTLWKKK